MSSQRSTTGRKAGIISVCPVCDGALEISEVRCASCDITIRGRFERLPLSGLSAGDVWFAEQFILASGSLKKMAELTDASYPTVRARLDEIIARLKSAANTRKSVPPTEYD